MVIWMETSELETMRKSFNTVKNRSGAIKDSPSAKRLENRDTRPTATARYVRMGSSKAKRVLDLIKGKSADYDADKADYKTCN
mgnify:CR=1 FL=1